MIELKSIALAWMQPANLWLALWFHSARGNFNNISVFASILQHYLQCFISKTNDMAGVFHVHFMNVPLLLTRLFALFFALLFCLQLLTCNVKSPR
jgi:hypothetical protein